MKILPTLAEVREIASVSKYNVLPVSCEILSDFTTPIETMKILKNVSTHCYMLESAQANETWGRYTFLGFDPKLEITCIDGEMKIGNLKVKTENPSAYLRQILADYKSPRFDYLPSFTGGLVGYFSYDYLGYSEPKLDEISMSAPTTICEIRDGWFKSSVITPEDFGFERCTKEDLKGGTPEENAKITISILKGEKGHKRNAVLMNTGAALYIGGKAESMKDGVALAADIIDSGKALETLNKLIEVSNRPEVEE